VSKVKTGRINELFGRMPDLEASDLHMKVGKPPIFRVRGSLIPSKLPDLTEKQMLSLVEEWLGKDRTRELFEKGSLDIGHDFGEGRVRVNVFMQRGMISLAARLINDDIPTLESLHLPPAIGQFVDLRQGLVLVCGITGSGKSTTLASIVDMINRKHRHHILTIEDPIEYLHRDKKSIVNQREIGLDCPSWSDALRGAVREDPDIILVGEMRDQDTFHAGLVAAETGHLVFGTMHTANACTTIGRILDLFPDSKHGLIRQGLSFNLRGIICQKLIPSFRKDVSRVPVVELMFMNPPIRKAIDEGNDARIADLIEMGKDVGMQSWTYSFVEMIREGFIDKKTAHQYVPNKEALDMALKGIGVASSGIG